MRLRKREGRTHFYNISDSVHGGVGVGTLKPLVGEFAVLEERRDVRKVGDILRGAVRERGGDENALGVGHDKVFEAEVWARMTGSGGSVQV